MSGLTVIGDIQVLYDTVKALEEKVDNINEATARECRSIFSSILARLDKLESVCSPEHVLELQDISWENVRAKRDYLLQVSDWTATSGCTIAPLAWAEYRQNLRDIPQTFGKYEPDQVIWPKQPSVLGPHTIETQEES